MTFSKGSLILVDYTAKLKDTDEVFDTTIEEDAKKHHIHEPGVRYQPKLISINEISYPVLKGLDEALAATSVGDKLVITVTPENGFGERDSGKIRMIPIRKLGDDAEKVSVGDTIEIDHKKGIVRFVGSGRVQIDYNHQYAGKTILYDVNVVRSLETAHDKIDVILENHLAMDDSGISFDLTDKEATIPVPKEILMEEGLQAIKYRIQSNIFKFVPTLEKINFVDTFLNNQIQQNTTETTEDAPETTEDAPETTEDAPETTEDAPKPAA